MALGRWWRACGLAPLLALLALLAACAPPTPPNPGSPPQSAAQALVAAPGAPPAPAAAASASQPEARRLWQQGAEAKHRGDLASARSAWRKAVAADPGNTAIAASLAELDAPTKPEAAPAPATKRQPSAGQAPAATPVAPARALPAGAWSGRCVGVTDGDTIRVMHDGREVKIRLAGVDAPEKSQAFGQRAKQATSALVFGRDVVVTPQTTDRYGRTVARVATPDGRDVSAALVADGLAWWYRQYAPGDTDLAAREAEAKAARRGLWADANPTNPADFRHGGKSASRTPPAPAPPAASPPPVAPAGLVYVTPSGKRYHAAGCSALRGGGAPVPRGEAQARGLTPCKICGGE